MSANLCYADAYLRECTAVVLETDDGAVLLDRTVFYPGGGGQPPDEGALEADGSTWRVASASKRGDDVWHRVDGDPPAPGAAVTVRLDWERRHRLMRTHSALHVLCGVVWRDHGAQVTGGNMEPLTGRMDFEFESMRGELVAEIERRVNEEVAADREIRVAHLPRDEAFAVPDLIRTKTARSGLPQASDRERDGADKIIVASGPLAGLEEIRIVEIVGLDIQADGGTHVARTSEIGRVRIAGYESKGRSNKRIRITLED